MLYFAYGSNMSLPQMAVRAPAARPLATARLEGYRPFVMRAGYIAIRPRAGDCVFGVLWDVSVRDLAVLDRYEGLDEGWYVRRTVAVRSGGLSRACLTYVGTDAAEGRRPIRDHFTEGVMAPALAWGLPSRYIATLARLARHGFRG